MSGGYFGAFTPGGTQYSAGTYATPGFTTSPYGFTAAVATGYASAFSGVDAGGGARQDTSVQPSPAYSYGSRPDAGYVTGAAPIYAAAAVCNSPTAASVIASLAAASKNTAGASTMTNAIRAPMPATTSGNVGTPTYTGYDAALYAAATNYLQSKAAGGGPHWLGLKKGCGGAGPNPGGGGPAMQMSMNSAGPGYVGVQNSGRPYNRKPANAAPRPQQLHYCDICKISCAGPQTYKEHLDGQKHKKKEAQLQGETQPLAKTKVSFRCDLCGVTCTGQDTYNAHIRGAKHQKTLKLHQTLGKPIPSTEPTIIPPLNAQKAVASGNTRTAGTKKIVGITKIAFVGGQKLNTTGTVPTTDSNAMNVDEKDEDAAMYLGLEKDVQPVGEDYVDPVKSEDGKIVQYYCKLCDCRFNDLNAKDMHLKGRRHRLQFKKKVNPDLEVDVKMPPKARRANEEKMRADMVRTQQRDMWIRRSMFQNPMMSSMGMHGAHKGILPLYHGYGMRPGGESQDDCYVMTKHMSILPTEDEVRAMNEVTQNVEKAMKSISDLLVPEKSPNADTEAKSADALAESSTAPPIGPSNAASIAPSNAPATAPAVGPATAPVTTPAGSSNGPSSAPSNTPLAAPAEERLLKGTLRVGPLAKSLLLHGECYGELVALCSEKPTITLLKKICELLPLQLNTPEKEQYTTHIDEPYQKIVVTNPEKNCMISVALTSVLMRENGPEAANKPDPPDVLDKNKCLEALAGLRHAKWFQARCANLESCAIVIRIFRDLCGRVPTWQWLSNWPLELLVEKAVSSAGSPLSPAEGVRRVVECIASGIFLPGGTGLMDPCEKESIDAISHMTMQQREDITASAQHALRLIAFQQIYKVLGMDRNIIKTSMQRKRPRDGENCENGEEPLNGKKDKKEEVEAFE